MNRLTRAEAAEFLGCGLSTLHKLERTKQLEGTYYQIGRRRIYIADKLEKWMRNGGDMQKGAEQC